MRSTTVQRSFNAYRCCDSRNDTKIHDSMCLLSYVWDIESCLGCVTDSLCGVQRRCIFDSVGPNINIRWAPATPLMFRDFFIFLFFIFVFYKNIFSFSKFTEIYPDRLAAGRPAPDRPAAGRQRLICKNFHKKIIFRSLKDRPGAGSRPAGPG